MNFKLVTRELGRTINRNSPSILTGLGIAGFFSSIVMAAKATPKAIEMIEEAKYQEGKFAGEQGYELIFGPKEEFLAAYKAYIPTAGMALLSATTIIMANRINLRRNAALASLYAIAQSGLQDYQAKVVETLGEKKEQAIRGEVIQQKLNDHPVNEGEILLTNKGNTLCYENLSGRYFRSDRETLGQIQNEFNERLIVEMTLTLNELYSDMGLPHNDLGDKAGWTIEKGLMEFKFYPKFASNGEPCIGIDYARSPEALWF